MIELVNCYKSYDKEKTFVLSDLNIKIEKGEFIGITGKSGSGKTTLLNIIGTLDQLSSGKYVIDNVNISKLNARELAEFRNKNIGFVFQEYLLIPYLSVKENLLLPVLHVDKNKRKDYEDKAIHIASLLGIDKLMNQNTKKLSGGEKQRVSLARSIINDPLMILADEPTGNLDKENAIIVLKELVRINKTLGVTVIMVTHDESLLSVCDKVLNLKDGKLELSNQNKS